MGSRGFRIWGSSGLGFVGWKFGLSPFGGFRARCVLGFDVGFEGPVITFLVFGVFAVLMMRAAVLGARVRRM